MRGGCWDAATFAEEVQAALEAWLGGELSAEQALQVILDAAYEYHFAPAAHREGDGDAYA